MRTGSAHLGVVPVEGRCYRRKDDRIRVGFDCEGTPVVAQGVNLPHCSLVNVLPIFGLLSWLLLVLAVAPFSNLPMC
jgi:hypothetical protein